MLHAEGLTKVFRVQKSFIQLGFCPAVCDLVAPPEARSAGQSSVEQNPH